MKHGFPTDFEGIPKDGSDGGGVLPSVAEELKACGIVCFKILVCFVYPGGYSHSFIVIFEKMLLTTV